MQEEANKLKLRQFYDLITQGEDRRAAEVLAEDLVWKEVATSRPMILTKEQVVHGFGRMRAGFVGGKLSMTVSSVIAEGNKLAVEFESHAETKAGKTYNNKYHAVWEFRGDEVREVRSYSDTAHAMAVIMIQPEAK
jgi:ketosteroid isomerase-like protein